MRTARFIRRRDGSRKRRGQGLVEYALIIGAVAIVMLLSVSMLGHKSNDLVATLAATLPGAHADDNLTITSGELVESVASGTNLVVDVATIVTNVNTERLGINLGFGAALDTLVLE